MHVTWKFGVLVLISFLKELYTEFSNDRCARMAAALAYYTLFSLVPLLLVVMGVSGLLFDPQDVQASLQQQITALIGSDGARQINLMLTSADYEARGIFATIAGGFVLMLGASGVGIQLQDALNEAWGVAPDPEKSSLWSLIKRRVFSFTMIASLGFLLMVSLLATAVISAFSDRVGMLLGGEAATGLFHLLNFSVSLALFTIMLALIFRFLPMAKIAWGDVWVASIVTALLFLVGKFGIGIYLGSQNIESSFGAAGSLVIVLVWIYYSATILLFGAEFAQLWAKRKGHQIIAEPGAVRFQVHFSPKARQQN